MSENEVLFNETQLVAIGSLKPYDKNPRRGNVKAIADSLTLNKQYRPIVVQKKTKKILAGNHTWQAAKALGWTKIAVVFIDVNDEEAKRIVLADNRTTDLAGYDDKILADLLKSLGSHEGTGYSESDMQAILGATEEAMSAVGDMGYDDLTFEEVLTASDNASTGRSPSMLFPADIDGDEEVSLKTGDDFEDADEHFRTSALQLTDDIYFEFGKNKYDIPHYRSDMFVESLPKMLQTWGGREASTDDGVSTYLWNYGLASSTGVPFDRAILAFFTHDFKWEGWWDKPAIYTTKVLNLGVRMAISPDFSIWWDDPKILQLYSIYRSQWFGRYFQEAGIRTIPRVGMHNNQEMLDISLMGIPKGVPVVGMQLQTVDPKNPDEMKAAVEGIQYIHDKIEPGQFLVYGGGTAEKIVEMYNGRGINIRFLENYAAVRRNAGVFGTGREIERQRNEQNKQSAD